jgi:hypothetical protein
MDTFFCDRILIIIILTNTRRIDTNSVRIIILTFVIISANIRNARIISCIQFKIHI